MLSAVEALKFIKRAGCHAERSRSTRVKALSAMLAAYAF
jgi:hypothetical protein